MDYSQLSDFEINKRVALAAGLSEYMFFDVDESCASGPVWTVPSGYYYLGLKSSKGNPFDPCNKPADAWPIIVENKIGLTPPMHDENWEAITFDKFGYVNKSEYTANPLRAAMIVFLLMKEKK